MPDLFAGSYSADIELPKGMEMTGYIARISPAVGVNDQLKVRSIALSDGKNKVLLIVCELLGLDSEFVDAVQDAISNETGFAKEDIIIACTHTHTGPASIFLQDSGKMNTDWMERLKSTIVGCAKASAMEMEPVEAFLGKGKSTLGVNRVIRDMTGDMNSAVKNRDDSLGVLILQSKANAGKKIILINYACHPVSIGSGISIYSGDYPHFMMEAVEKKLPEGAFLAFTNGCCGDIDPARGGTFQIAEDYGIELAEDVMNVLNSDLRNILDACKDTGILETRTASVEIPLVYSLDETALETFAAEYEKDYERESVRGDLVESRIAKAYVHWTENMRRKIKDGTLPGRITARMKILRIGKLVIVTLPFEPFHGIGLKIKALLGDENTLVLGYANGDFGYLPSKDLYRISGYESRHAYKFYGYPGPVSEDSEETILKAICESEIYKGVSTVEVSNR